MIDQMKLLAQEVDKTKSVNLFTINASKMTKDELDTLKVEAFPTIVLFENDGKAPIPFVPVKEITSDDIATFLKAHDAMK